ncbi:hypothetical protein PAPYR_10281 [Paratrimastix pyriformis]|uniref:Uncharacterized protein n=1 Tax=Paratrimastix pyriformis TaxID=342808 RepID=A0ABQ8UBY1_9EUKA|nr:hypothetical protein PAPYR_10281 [Paratrimastix pyriformis]
MRFRVPNANSCYGVTLGICGNHPFCGGYNPGGVARNEGDLVKENASLGEVLDDMQVHSPDLALTVCRAMYNIWLVLCPPGLFPLLLPPRVLYRVIFF